MPNLSKREFLAASIGATLSLSVERKALAQQDDAGSTRAKRAKSRKVKTTKLFRSPDGFPNAIAVTSEGLWIAEQKETGRAAAQYFRPEHASKWMATGIIPRTIPPARAAVN